MRSNSPGHRPTGSAKLDFDKLQMVKQLAASAAEERWMDLEAAVDATATIDPWCSGPDWVLPVAGAFAPEAEPLVLEADGAGFALLARHRVQSAGDIIAGLEPLWGFATPIIGSDLPQVAQRLASWLGTQQGWDRLVLPGLPNNGDLLRTLAIHLQEIGQLGVAPGITRQIIDLNEGVDAWLERRKPSFRRNLRNASRRAHEAGLSIAQVDPSRSTSSDLFLRLLDIEQQSWKGQASDGIASPEMGAFYHELIRRLAKRGRLRISIAQIDGDDVGYILGGVRNGRYRGLQLSYVESAHHLSVSHLLQLSEVKQLCGNGINTYDMGMDMEYKRRWADQEEASVVLVLDRT